MKNCTEKIVVISLIMLVYANDAFAQDKSTYSGGGICHVQYPPRPNVPLPKVPLPTQTLDEKLDYLLKSWFGFNAQTMKLLWMQHHTKLVTACSCSCTFNFDVNRKMTNLKILKSSGSKSVDLDVLNAIIAAAPEKTQGVRDRIGERTILVDFSNDPSDLNFPHFSMSLLDETDHSKDNKVAR